MKILSKTPPVFEEYYQHPRLMDKPIVLYPAGSKGLSLLQFLRSHGVEPVAFCDASDQKIGTVIDGILVKNVEEIIKQYGKDGVKYLVNSAFHFAEIYALLSSLEIPEDCIVPPGIKDYCDSGTLIRPIKNDDKLLQTLQENLLDLMMFFHNVCEKYNIPYFLYGGTLLGAVRHKGFIPWDDDVDIVMYRKDYNRFFKVVKKELGQKYMIEYNVQRKSIALKNSALRYFASKLYFAIKIDTFALDNVFPVSNRLSKLQEKGQVTFIHSALKHKWRKGDDNIFWYIGWISRGLAQIFAKMFNCINTGYVCYLCGVLGWREKRTFEQTLFNKDERILLEFEGHSFYAPEKYDVILKQMYGDYMELPPPHLQVSTHALAEINFDTTKSVNIALEDD